MSEPAAGHRRTWWWPFLIAGAICVVGGGLLAAVTASITTRQIAWATAYIVLIGGAAQIALGAAVTWLHPRADTRLGWGAFIAWNVGNAGVLVGQLADTIALTYLGSAALIGALALVLGATIRATPRSPAADAAGVATDGPARAGAAAHHPLLLWAFRALLVVLVVSIGVGIGLAQLGR